MSALVFNTRRPMFEDARVRRAFILLFDAEWINRSLFDGAYKRTQSFFERSELSSHGQPADARERALLAPFAQYVKPEVLEGSFRLPATDGSGENRQPARPKLLGGPLRLKGGRLVKGGVPLTFEFWRKRVSRSSDAEPRQTWALGIGLRIRQVVRRNTGRASRPSTSTMIQWT